MAFLLGKMLGKLTKNPLAYCQTPAAEKPSVKRRANVVGLITASKLRDGTVGQAPRVIGLPARCGAPLHTIVAPEGMECRYGHDSPTSCHALPHSFRRLHEVITWPEPAV